MRILLIASDTGNIKADREIRELEKHIGQKNRGLNIKTEITSIPTKQASLQTVSKLLDKCAYHLVHYAGHAAFDAGSGEESGLFFWEKSNRRGKVERLVARSLARLLRGSQTRLFYLSTCVGATVGAESLLHQYDFLGVMDALVQAGLPSVLGFRWNVSDERARTFAGRFYNALFETRAPARAVHAARRSLYMEDASDETWTSPILVVQQP